MYMDTFLSGTLRGIQYFFVEADLTSPLASPITPTRPSLYISLIKALGDEITAQSHKANISQRHLFEERSCEFSGFL